MPAEWDGAGLDYLALSVILEEIAAGDGATSTIVSVNNCPVCSILMAWGSDAQKEQWLRPLARGEMLGAFCLTEPHAGSQADALRTTRRRDGADYVMNGVKQFITSGKNGDVAIVMAVTDKGAGKKGISAFIVPTATPGYCVARLEDKLGQHASDTAQILFENCRDAGREPARRRRAGPEDRAVRPRRRPHRHRLAGDRHGARRVRCGAGLCEGAGRLRQADLRAPGACSSALPTWRCRSRPRASWCTTPPSLKDAGLPCLKEAAMGKLFASEMAERVCSDAIQIHGGYGYVSDFPVERIYRDVRVCQIYEGTSDVQKILIGRALA